MVSIAIISSQHPEAHGRLILVARILKARGHDVILIADDEPIPKGLDLVAVANEYIPIIPKPCAETLPFADWRRERDYPTLKQGLRMAIRIRRWNLQEEP